jgi:hypothetical protein
LNERFMTGCGRSNASGADGTSIASPATEHVLTAQARRHALTLGMTAAVSSKN